MTRLDYESLTALTPEQRAELKTFDNPPPHVAEVFIKMREERARLPEPAAMEPESFDAAVKRLAAMPPHEYDRVRKDEAKGLDCQVKTLDNAVAKARGDDETIKPGSGRPLDVPAPEPWPDPVDGAELLGDLTRIFARYVALPPGAATALALWAVHTHCFDIFGITPRLAITSPVKRCGKTTLLRVLRCVVCKPLTASNISPAAMFRTIELVRPTLLVDEADTFLHDNEELRGVVNSGHGHDGNVIRLVGDDHEPRQFSTFAPVAIACIGHVPATIADRSIEIKMRRRKPDEAIERFRQEEMIGLGDLRKCARWINDNIARLKAANSETLAGLHDRAADNWRGLVAIADLAGHGWGERARKAALLLSGQSEETDTESARVALLADIKTIFDETGDDKISSADLVERLVAMGDTRPWAEWKHGKAITARQMAKLLGPFGIAPSTIRLASGTPKGYRLDTFYDAWSRYTPISSATPTQPAENCGIPGIFDPPQTPNVADRKSGSNPQKTAPCDAVSDQKPETPKRVQISSLNRAAATAEDDPEKGQRPVADDDADLPDSPCVMCGHSSFWKSVETAGPGRWRCQRCDGPPKGVYSVCSVPVAASWRRV